VTAFDNEPTTSQMTHWLEDGHATWGTVINGRWTEYQIHQDGAHPLAEVLERHLPERAA